MTNSNRATLGLLAWAWRLLYMARRAIILVAFYLLPVTWQRLRLSVRRRSHVRDLTEGRLRHAGRNWALLVVWQAEDWPWFLDVLLDALARQGTNVLLVANALPQDAIADHMLDRCAVLLRRDNQGFDFGGFQDGYDYLMNREDPQRVLFANDSVVYYPGGLDQLLDKLLPAQAGADVISTFENREYQFHFQSFLFSVSASLLRSAAVQRFWQQYLPISNRRWCILRGEIGLSRCLLRAGRSFEVIASGVALAQALVSMEPTELLALRGDATEELRTDWDALRPLVKQASVQGPSREAAKASLIMEVVALCQKRSPPHCAPFLYARLLGIRLLKRDLIWRDRYSLTELEWSMRRSGLEDRLDEVMAGFRRRGRGSQLRGIQRARYDIGVI
ncbi:hypothetical protein EOD42_00720 [Rhodovarius crocodyli]|uniref:Rhamnan synthesis protein F n=1 Tax=Rhodovarius crocodyli TaxID=1979269 RepID=A0A437MM05_9PROT|nr:hypothetical protein [Rhodovarius crocodyli]RVT98671.1 hypothetical protein EOD42_00720 [Rhodovarius crocodyli]